MPDYTPKTWGDGDVFEAADASSMSAQIDEEEERNDAQDPLIAAAEESAEIAAVAARGIRPAGFTPGQWYFATSPSAASTSAALGGAVIRTAGSVIPHPLPIDRLFYEVTVAGDAAATFRPGVWADDGTGKPGVLVADGGSGPTTAGQHERVVAATLPPGLYWWGGVLQTPGAQPTIRICSATALPPLLLPLGTALGTLSQGSAYAWTRGGIADGALPSPFGTAGVSGNIVPRIGFRVAA